MTRIECVVSCGDTLGEGPVWDDAAQALWWVDIEGARLHRFEPAGHRLRDWNLPERVAALALRREGGLVLALESGFAFFDPEREGLERLPRPPRLLRGQRFNDGKCGFDGRFWAGTMREQGEECDAGLYCLEPDHTVRHVLGGVGVSNGLTWSPDGRALYFADSKTKLFRMHDYSPADGAIGPARPFHGPEGLPGVPDGATTDAEGFVWSARHDGGCLVRHAPDGSVDRVVELPVRRPTSCTFGGPELRTLFITSARQGLSAGQLAEQPCAGGILAFEPGPRGLPAGRYAG